MHAPPIAEAIAAALVEDLHYRLFRETSVQAKERFELAAWAVIETSLTKRAIGTPTSPKLVIQRHAPDKNRTCARGLGNRCSIH